MEVKYFWINLRLESKVYKGFILSLNIITKLNENIKTTIKFGYSGMVMYV